MDNNIQMPKIIQDMLSNTEAVRKKRQILSQMYTERTQYESTWKQLSNFINPFRGRINDDKGNEGKRRDIHLLDPYPMEASAKCASGLHSGLTSPSRPWFELGLQDEEMARFHAVKLWLDDCKDILMDIYAKSNIYNMLLQVEAELTQFGTAASLLVQDYNTGVWARPYTCGEYAGGIDARGRITMFARKFKLNAWQMVAEFGYDVCSSAVQNAYRSNNLTLEFEINMLIEKNLKYREEEKKIGSFPWMSYYWETSVSDRFLKVAGYNEIPFIMPRWTMIANNVYGTGPGHNALGNCMQLQKLEKINMRLLDNRANPAMIIPTSVAKVDSLPGGRTKVPDNLMNQIVPLFKDTGSREDIRQTIEAKQQQIGSAFFNDLFVMIANQDLPQMTAREVAERHEEKLLMLSPVLEQMHNEVLAPLTKRTFGIALRNGLLPPMPEEIKPDDLKVEFISLLAQAQKMVAAPSIEKIVAFAGNLAGANPEIMDNIDFDAAVRRQATLYGSPEAIMRSEDDVKEMRAKRAQAMEQQKQVEQAAQMAQPLKNGVEAARLLSETPVNEQSALNTLLGGGN